MSETSPPHRFLISALLSKAAGRGTITYGHRAVIICAESIEAAKGIAASRLIEDGYSLDSIDAKLVDDSELEKLNREIERLQMELALRRPTDSDVAQTRQARKDYRAKLKELYGNADALPMQISRLKSEAARYKAALDHIKRNISDTVPEPDAPHHQVTVWRFVERVFSQGLSE